MPASPDETIRDLCHQAEEAAADHVAPFAALVPLLKLLIGTDVDAYLFAGVLIEAVAATVALRIPPEIQAEVSVETVRLLRDRLYALGALG